MERKILCLFYRPPDKNGDQCAFGQELFLRVIKEYFLVKVIAFNSIDKKNDNTTLIKLSSGLIRKIFSFLFFLKSPRFSHYKSNKFMNEFRKELRDFKPDYIYAEQIFMMQYPLRIKSKGQG